MRDSQGDWHTPTEFSEASGLAQSMAWRSRERGVAFGAYADLWRWSVENLDAFWSSIWDRHGVSGRPAPQQCWPTTGCRAPSGVREPSSTMRDTWCEPPIACAFIGAIWSICAPDFGTGGVVARFAQLSPRIPLAAGGFQFGGRTIDRAEDVRRVVDGLPTLEHVIWVDCRAPGSSRPPVSVGHRLGGNLQEARGAGQADAPGVAFDEVADPAAVNRPDLLEWFHAFALERNRAE